MLGTRTLASRLFLLTSIWAVFATILVAWYLSQNYRASAQENLTQRLTANLYNIMGSVSPDPAGKLTGNPDLRDSRFQAFQSGYYWSVTEISDPSNRRASPSLGGGRIIPDNSARFDSDFQRSFAAADAAGNRLIGIEAQAFLGEGDNLYTFRITGNVSEVDTQVSEFVRELLLVLALFAIGFVLASFFIVRIGLLPLKNATESLAEIREGRAERLEGKYPFEIQPLIDETNSLIASNRNVVERARTQVGNLAHSLKTPLAVVRNEGAKARPAVRRVIEDQVSQMQNQIQHYLDRARISARAGSVTSRTDIKPVTERLLRVMQKLNPNLTLELKVPYGAEIWFAGEQQDFEEMLGNLLENACKFAKSRIVVGVNVEGRRLRVTIGDDGPGMSRQEAAAAMQRGTRLDESKPGSGLGLSIVKDIASEYSGQLELGESELGGLAANLVLPLVTKK